MSAGAHLGLTAALKWRGIQLSALLCRRFPVAGRLGAPLLGELGYFLAPRQRHNVVHNLRVFEPGARSSWRHATCRSIFRSVARYYVELMQLPEMDLRRHFARVQVDGIEHLVEALGRGRGVIIAGIHLGPAEIALHGLAAYQIPYTAMVERLQPPQLAALLHRIRASHGQTYVYPDLAGTKLLIRTLRAGGVVALLTDRDVLGTGIDVLFCGATVRVPPGPVELARLTNATVLPAVAYWQPGGGFAIEIMSEFHVSGARRSAALLRDDMERLLARFEPYLRRRPGQWLVLEPFWQGREPRQMAEYTEGHSRRPPAPDGIAGGMVGDGRPAHPHDR